MPKPKEITDLEDIILILEDALRLYMYADNITLTIKGETLELSRSTDHWIQFGFSAKKAISDTYKVVRKIKDGRDV